MNDAQDTKRKALIAKRRQKMLTLAMRDAPEFIALSRRLRDMMDEFEIDDLGRIGRHILEKSRLASLEAIRKIKPGTFKFSMRVDGYDKPIDLVAAMTIGETGIDVDFAGTSGISAYGINVPLCYTEAYASFGVKCIVAPKIPNNEGSLSVIRITAPEGTILNAKPPAPVATRHVTGQMLPDVVFGCLHQALGGEVPAEGTSCLWNLFAMGGPGCTDDPAEIAHAVPFNVMSFHAGGTGARPGKDGLSATAFPSGVRNMPVEVNEAISPIVIWKKEYRPDTGGAGQFRGGLGQVMEVGNLDPAPFALSAYYDRIRIHNYSLVSTTISVSLQFGADYADTIAGAVHAGREGTKAAVESFAAIGADELILHPAHPDLDEIGKLAEAVL